MKTFYLLVFTCSIILAGCNTDFLNEPISVKDSELQSKIIGTWTNTYYSVTFSSDLKFIDTTFGLNNNFRYEPTYSRIGIFEIKDGVLTKRPTHWNIIDTTFAKNGITIVPFDVEIRIEGKTMSQKTVEVYSAEGKYSPQIWGEWNTIKWIYGKSTRDTNILYEGREEYFYIFYKDSSKAIYGWKYLDGNPWQNPKWKTDFSYNPPYLDLPGSAEYKIKVEFKYNKMFWYFNYQPSILYKVK